MDNAQQALIQSELADELRLEGIFCKGYGIIPKLVMLDQDLSLEAKAIYAYFSSYSGAGNCAFPGRDKILSDLKMCKDAYYKHYTQLLTNGYITVKQEKTSGCQFQKNIYTLVSSPEKLFVSLSSTAKTAVIRSAGLKAGGFGQIAKALMTDTRLTVKSKGLYAYYASFAGAGESAFPNKSTALYHLSIGSSVYEKCNRELIRCNYIIVRQRHVNGRLGVNDIILTNNPDTSQAVLHRQIEKITADPSQYPQKQDTDFPHTEPALGFHQSVKKQDTGKQHTVKQDAEIQDTNNNSYNNQQFNKINSSINQERLTRYYESRQSLFRLVGKNITPTPYTGGQKQEHDFCICELFTQKQMPAEWIRQPQLLKASVETLLDDDIQGRESFWPNTSEGGEQWKTYKLFRNSLIALLTAQNGSRISGNLITADQVFSALQNHIQVDEPKMLLGLDDFAEEAMENFREADIRSKVHNRSAYMKACIWSLLQAEN